MRLAVAAATVAIATVVLLLVSSSVVDPIPSTRPLEVRFGPSATQPDQVTAPPYKITFKETGLASGTAWSVTLNGSTEFATAGLGAIPFTGLSNGTYSYGVGTVNGYGVTPSIGRILVNGGNQTRTLAFDPLGSEGTFRVTFFESGLPAGTAWSIACNGSVLYTSGSILAFELPNGTTSFGVGDINGYTSSPSVGTVVVTGSNLSVTVTFKPITFLGLSLAAAYALVAAGVALLVVLLLGLLVWWYRGRTSRRRARPAPPTSPPPKT